MDTTISDVPVWAIPKVVMISKEIEGEITSIAPLSDGHVQITSTNGSIHRVDDVSKTGYTTIHTNEDGYRLYLLSSNKLILASIFGTPDSDNSNHYNKEGQQVMV